MSHQINSSISVVGIDIGKSSFHVVGVDQRRMTTSSSADAGTPA